MPQHGNVNIFKMRRSAIAACALLAAMCLSPLNVSAQTNGSNSPYSRYGLGLLSDQAQGFNKGMAGTALGMRGGREINVKNPASYSELDSLNFIFDFGMSLQNANLSQNGSKVNAHNTSIDYISLGFRASRNLGFSLGMLPFSTVGYSVSEEKTINEDDATTQTTTNSGDGGLHEVYVGVGWRPFKPVSIGANVGYLWGDLTNTVLASYSTTSISSSRRQYTADIRTYKADFGLQFMSQIGSKHRFVLGLTYGLGHDIKSNAYFYNQTVTSSTTTGDTLKAINPYALPHTFGVGLTWQWKQSLRVGVDYTFQQWSKVKSPTLSADARSYAAQTGAYTDMHKVSIGAEYVPDPEGLSWHKRIRYRLGFAYTTPYTKVDGGDGPKDFLVSAGVALPIINTNNNRSVVNINVQYERVKPQFSHGLTENYIRLCLGITFNERWFMKWKVQ